MKRIKEIWQAPELVPYSEEYDFYEAIAAADGSKLLFSTKRRLNQSEDSENLDLWMMERKDGAWRVPRPLDSVFNSAHNEAFCSLAKSGNLYFFRNYQGQRGCEIVVSKNLNGAFTSPESLGPAINTEKHECDPFIDPDERLLIYCVRDREGGFGKNDLYVSFKTETGTWTRSINLGPGINGESEEITPHISVDGKYLFFSSNRQGQYDIYWVDAKIIEKLKPKELR